MSEFYKKYNETLNNISGTLGANNSKVYSDNLQSSIDKANYALQNEYNNRINVNEGFLKGWLSEHWHAETFNINAKARGNSDVWAKVEGSNKTGEDISYGNSYYRIMAELKYNHTAARTCGRISDDAYIGKDKIVPKDQLELIRAIAQKRADKIEFNRPDKARHYQDTADNASDRLEMDGITSKPLDEVRAKEMAEDFKRNGEIDPEKFGLTTEEFVSWSDIGRESGQAALHAAVLSAAISAAPHVWNTLKEYIDNGDVNLNELSKNGTLVMNSSTTAGLRGGISAALTASCKTGLMGKSLKSLSPSAIGMATTIAINVIDYSLKLHRNEISHQEFANYCIKDSLILSSAMIGAAIGQVIIPVPLIGALVGNLVGATLGGLAYGGGNQIILGICVENGWTFFGLVEQDYSVDENILKEVGYDLITVDTFKHEKFQLDDFKIDSFLVNSLDFFVLKRGVISTSAIGYV